MWKYPSSIRPDALLAGTAIVVPVAVGGASGPDPFSWPPAVATTRPTVPTSAKPSIAV